MRNRKRKWVKDELKKCAFFIKDPEKNKGKWKNAFQKEQPIYLELGCGKGTFISKMANNHPEINYIAIDMIDDMLGLAKRNIEREFSQTKKEIGNVLLTAWDIERLPLILDGDIIDRIYINFCNPWPRPRHNKRRLTHPKQLELYKNILKEDGEIYFKTDDEGLYIASQHYFEETGFEIIKKTDNLHEENIFEENIITEHEKMFTDEGIKIKAIMAKKLAILDNKAN